MKKILTLLVFVLCFSFASAATTVLDSVAPGSLSTWNQFFSAYNPTPTYSEITSPYDGSTAIKTEVTGTTLMYCDTKYISKVYETGTYNSGDVDLKAYLAFNYSGTEYNFPYVAVYLLDSSDNVVGQHIWYGKGIVGSYYQGIISSGPSSYTELSSDKGYFTLDLSDIGTKDFTKIQVGLYDYTCEGTNSIIFDELSLVETSSSHPTDTDGDGVADSVDNCVSVANPDQLDDDHDGIGNACDNYNCISTGAEVCGDGVDNNCDGNVDEGCDETPVEIPEFGVIAGGLALVGALGVFLYRRK